VVFISQRSLRRLARRFWGILFTLVIALAVAVQFGREAFPLLNDYRNDISQLLGERLGVNIQVGEVSSSWSGMRPQMELRDVVVTSLQDQPIFDIDLVIAQLSLVDSLFSGRLRWRHLAFHNLNTTLKQTDAGPWQIKHLKTSANTDGFRIKDPLDIFLFGRRVELERASFHLEFRTGHESVLNIPRITLENDKDFHRITASAGVSDALEPSEEQFQLVIEGSGDPRDAENFNASGYLALKQFPVEQVVAAFAGKHWRSEAGANWREGHRVDMELWYRGSTKKGIALRGQLRSDGLPLKVPEHIALPEEMRSQITGHWHPLDGWALVLQGLSLQWPDFSSPALNLEISGGLNKTPELAIDMISVEPWLALAGRTGVLAGRAQEVLETLSPTGIVKNVGVVFTNKEAGYFRLRGELVDVSLKSFRGSPEADYVNGFVSASAFDGYVDLESEERFRMFFPKIYNQALDFADASGRVAWQVDMEHKLAYVSSSRLHLHSDEEQATGYLWLKLPLVRDGREPKMTLAIGVSKAPVSVHRKYVPKVIPRNLYRWLGNSIGDGSASNIAFLYHGSISKDPEVHANIQLYADVHDGNLTFDPKWPALRGVDGRLVLDNRRLDVKLAQAKILGNRVSNAEVKLIQNPEDQGLALAIAGQLKSNAAAAMELLQNSPVRSVFGSTFDSWKFDGDVSAAISLLVPLDSEAEGLRQSVNVRFDRARVDMRDIRLAVEQVSGELSYNSHSGLVSKGLQGQLWGKPFNATIESPRVAEGRSERDTVIHVSGPVEIADIRQWTKRPELGFVEGGAQVEGQLIIPAKGLTDHKLELDLHSHLQGVSLLMPKPLQKQAEEEKPLNVVLRLYEDSLLYHFAYDDAVTFRLHTGDNIETAAQVSIGEQPLPLQPGFFDVIGAVEEFDLVVWDEVRERYFEYLAAMQEAESQEANLPIRLNLDIGRATLGDASLEALHVNGLGTEEQWDLRVESDLLAGDVVVKSLDDNLDVGLELDYLHFVPEADVGEQETVGDVAQPTEEAVAAEKVWQMSDLQLSKLTFPVHFAVDELSYGGEPYGRWAFDITPIDDGILVSNILANIRGLAIGRAITDYERQWNADKSASVSAKGEKKGEKQSRSRNASDTENLSEREFFQQQVLANPKAEFIWRQDAEGNNHSAFRGSLMARDAGSLLQAWGVEKTLESDLIMVSAEVSWEGAPDQIALQTVEGQVLFDLEDGSFIRGDNQGDNGFLRLIGLFNFDTIARRLKLDFTDLAKEGFGFEYVHGNFEFQDGWVYINEPLVVDSTTSRLQLAGTLDLVEEKIDAELVATLPVAGDITVAAGLIAGLPAAVGVFLISQMFKDQVDRASSINYRVRGSWESPKIKFRKIFDDTAASKKAREVEKAREKSQSESKPQRKERVKEP